MRPFIIIIIINKAPTSTIMAITTTISATNPRVKRVEKAIAY